MSLRARRELGQHFLVDRNLLGVIGELARLGPDDVVLEIGPGRGILTRYLAERVAHVHAVEIDRALAPELTGIPRTNLVFGDALAVDLAGLLPTPGKLVANLPYNVATPIIAESLEGLPSLERWCVMVQREVGERLFATPRTKAYGAVSVLVQLVCERSGSHRVSREVFRPRPNVESTLVAFTRIAPGLPSGVRELVEAAFAHRRKTLANSLELAGGRSRAQAQAALRRLGLDPGLRAEELAPADYVALARELA
jgi:16S rRNA (adenine1518-N6/adenine1519-N6)-dimethyltransferase